MYIKIVGFKIHIDVEFIFENGTMILLRGESGCGKSTILQAIFWALYGNMRSIYNNMGVTKNLSVTLGLPDMVIFRKKNPELLTVKIDKTYEDQVAQSIINSRYGNKELWKACSYIEQKARCSLIEGSNKERMELLNFLSFTGENPKEYIEKINEKLKDVTNNFNSYQSNFIAELNIFTENLKETPVTKILSEEEINKTKEEIIFLEKEEKKKHEEVLEQERLIGTYNYIFQNHKKLIQRIEELKNVVFENLEAYKASSSPILNIITDVKIPSNLYEPNKIPNLNDEIILSYSNYIFQKNKLTKDINSIQTSFANKERLEIDLNDIKNKLAQCEKFDNFHIITDEEIWKIKIIEQEQIKYLEECKSLGIEYNEEKIVETLNQLKLQLKNLTNLERNIENYNKLLNIETSISSLKKSLNSEFNIEELENLSREKVVLISELKKGLELLPCPNCKIPLRYINNSLQLGERNPVSPSEIKENENEYKNILTNLSILRDILKLEENREILTKTVDKMEMEKFINTEKQKIPSLSNFITRLTNIKYIETPSYSSSLLSQVQNYQKLKKKEESIINSLKSIIIDGDVSLMKEQLNQLEEKYKLEQERIQKNQELTKEYQKKEDERLKELSKYENEKKKMEEKEKENIIKLEKYKKNEEENYKKYNQKKEILENNKRKIESEIKNCEERINENNLEETKKKIDNTCKEVYIKIVEELKEKKKLLNDGIYGNKILKRRDELETKRNCLIEIQKDMTTLNRLKLKAIEIECKQLEDTVNNINSVLETTLPIFFPDPISLKLLLYKKIKTGDKIKPGLNLEISYRGMKYENINSLSGGEGDRISLALLLALNSVSNSPIILLDECVSSLDGNLKENCIEAIKSIPNKTVICIDHDDSLEGFYDSIIDIKL